MISQDLTISDKATGETASAMYHIKTIKPQLRKIKNAQGAKNSDMTIVVFTHPPGITSHMGPSGKRNDEKNDNLKISVRGKGENIRHSRDKLGLKEKHVNRLANLQ